MATWVLLSSSRFSRQSVNSVNRRRMLMALGAGGVAAGVGYLIARTGLGASDSKNALTRLPEFSLPTTRGDIFSSTELAGRITLLNFWATWCAPCRKEIPLLIATQALYRKDVAVVGIAIDELDAVQPFEDEIGLDYLSLIGKAEGMSLMQAFGNPGHLPFTLLFDRSSNLRNRKTGEMTAPEIEAWLKPLI